MSTNAASEEALGLIHTLTAKKIEEFLGSDDPLIVEKGLKLAVAFLDKNKITCVTNEINALGELDKALMRKKKRFGEHSEVADMAAERAKRAVGDI